MSLFFFKLFFPAFLVAVSYAIPPLTAVAVLYAVWVYSVVFVTRKSYLVYSREIVTMDGHRTTYGIVKCRVSKCADVPKGLMRYLYVILPLCRYEYHLVENIGHMGSNGKTSLRIKKNVHENGVFKLKVISKDEANNIINNPSALDTQMAESYENRRRECLNWIDKLAAAGIVSEINLYDSLVTAKVIGEKNLMLFIYGESRERVVGMNLTNNKIPFASYTESILGTLATSPLYTLRSFDDSTISVMCSVKKTIDEKKTADGRVEVVKGVCISQEAADRMLSKLTKCGRTLTDEMVRNAVSCANIYKMSILYSFAVFFGFSGVCVIFVLPPAGIGCLIIAAFFLYIESLEKKKADKEYEKIKVADYSVQAYICEQKIYINGGEDADTVQIVLNGKPIDVPQSIYDTAEEGVPFYVIRSLAGGQPLYYSAAAWMLDETVESKINN